MNLSQIIENGGDLGMLRSVNSFVDGERALKKSLRRCVTAQLHMKLAKSVECARDARMLGAALLFQNRQRSLIERLRFRILALGVVKTGETAETRGDILVLSAKN